VVNLPVLSCFLMPLISIVSSLPSLHSTHMILRAELKVIFSFVFFPRSERKVLYEFFFWYRSKERDALAYILMRKESLQICHL
jgi:hypothetical protein